jgi:UDP:flavonoid glycosyltransferase YjiC (YdhE family)
MRVLLAAPSSRGRLHNLVPMAWALRTSGHDVKIAGRPAFVDTILRTGTVAVEVGTDDVADSGWLADPSAVDDLVDFAMRWRPDVVISDERAPAGAVAAKAVGAAKVRMVGAADQPPRGRDDAAELTERVAASLVSHDITMDETMVVGDATFDALPPSLRDGAGGYASHPVRPVPYAGPAVVPAWLRRTPRRPRIWLTLTRASTFGAVFEAVGGLAVEVVCATAPDRIAAGTVVPGNVRLVDSAPPLAVLPTCSAVVHDGDPDTAVAALAHGLPQLAVAAEPAPPLAVRLAAIGAGLLASESGLWQPVNALLTDDSLRARAGELGAEIASTPLPRALVPLLLELAANR